MKPSYLKRLESLKSNEKIVYPYSYQFTDEADYIRWMDEHNPGTDWRKNYRSLDSFY